MKLRGRYRLLVRGDLSKMTSTNASIAYLFERLLTGQAASISNLRNLGIEVRQLDDRDEIISVSEPDER